MKMHHVSIATDNIKRMKEYVKDFIEVIDVSEEIFDPVQNAKLCMIRTKMAWI